MFLSKNPTRENLHIDIKKNKREEHRSIYVVVYIMYYTPIRVSFSFSSLIIATVFYAKTKEEA